MKMSNFEAWAIEHPYEYWSMRDKHINEADVRLYENLWRDKKNKNLVKQGLELLYVERKEITSRKTHHGSKAGGCVLRWRGEGASQPIRGTEVITQELTDIQPQDVGVENGFDDLGSEDINGEVGFGLTDGD
jgi:hypothetical protein